MHGNDDGGAAAGATTLAPTYDECHIVVRLSGIIEQKRDSDVKTKSHHYLCHPSTNLLSGERSADVQGETERHARKEKVREQQGDGAANEKRKTKKCKAVTGGRVRDVSIQTAEQQQKPKTPNDHDHDERRTTNDEQRTTHDTLKNMRQAAQRKVVVPSHRTTDHGRPQHHSSLAHAKFLGLHVPRATYCMRVACTVTVQNMYTYKQSTDIHSHQHTIEDRCTCTLYVRCT